MDSEELFTRRELAEMVWRAAALPGAALFFSTFFSTALRAQSHNHEQSGAPPDPMSLQHYQPKFFAAEDFRALQAFTEILIPTDDAPGAGEAYCAQFIDFILQASGEMPQTQTAWRHAMEVLKATGFHAANAGRQAELVSAMSRPEMDPTAKHPAFSAYRLIKQQTAYAFYTSRRGMIETLDYKGNSYNITFPACNHPEHQTV